VEPTRGDVDCVRWNLQEERQIVLGETYKRRGELC
jgi:hypothetical protein